jgi:hypothetical protein
MAYDEQETRQNRVVVQTPSSRREVVETERQYAPERSGVSTAMVAALVVVSAAVVALLVLFLMNRSSNDTNNANLAAQQQPPQTTIVQQPAQQPPVVVQQPAPASQPAPIIVNPPAGSAASVPDDTSIQAEIDKRLAKDSTLSALVITATVLNGKVTLTGTVKTEQLKHQVEKFVQAVKGVKAVDNQILVMSAT